jgi:MFS family permease
MLKDKTFVGLNLSVFCMMVGVGLIVVILPQRVIELDGNSRNVGYLASMFAIAYIVLQVPIGRLADTIGIKQFVVAGYLLCSAAGFCFYYSTSSTALYLSRLLQGAGEAPIWALAPALLSMKYPSRKGKVIGFYNAMLHVGLTLGPLLGVALARLWRSENDFLLYALACLVGAVTSYALLENIHAKERIGVFDLGGIKSLTKNGKVFLVLMGITLYGTGYGFFLTTLPAYLLEYKQCDSVHLGLFFSLFYIAISISQLVTGKLSDTFGPTKFMAIGLGVAAICLGALPGLNLSFSMAVLTAASLGLGVFYLASMIFLNETVGENLKGTISGAYYVFWGIGMFFGPPALSALSTRFGPNSAMMVYAVLYGMMAIIMATRLRGSHRSA